MTDNPTTPFTAIDKPAGPPIPVLALHSRHQQLHCCTNPDIHAAQSISFGMPTRPDQSIVTSHDCQNCNTETLIHTTLTTLKVTDLVTRPNPRPPSPADTRTHLDPTTVDALAHEYHTLHCLPLSGPDPTHDHHSHIDTDRAKARFLLMGLRQHGYTLTPTN